MLPELKFRSFPIVYFVKTSFLEERVHILLFKNKITKLPEHSQNIFKKSNIVRCMETPNATSCNRKCCLFKQFF